MTNKIVLAAIGSLGDLHPVIAVALALRAWNITPVLAVSENHVGKVRAAGLEAVSIMPDFEEIGRGLGLSPDALAKRIFSDQDFLVRHVLMHSLEDSVRALDDASENALAIAGTSFAFASPIVAEMRRLPFIQFILQPMLMLSHYDPPRAPEYAILAGAPTNAFSRSWNRAWIAIIRIELRRRYAGLIDRARLANGLKRSKTAPIFDVEVSLPLKLGLYSPVLVEPGDRLPVNTKLVGFPIFDSESGAENGMPLELERFLDRGPPPLVFTLGSFAVRAPGSFYEESLKAARDLGMRAVLLTGNDSTAYPGDDVLACRYAPHSQLFPRAAVIIHHGGIGTTGQALKAGKPELVVPHMGDQWDNGARIRRLGVGAVLGAGRYTAVRARTALGALCADNALRQRAIDLAARVEAENGAQAAAEAIARCLGR